MSPDPAATERAIKEMVAPGTALREGLERILSANTGALVVMGAGPAVEGVSSAGFRIDDEFTPQRASELAKMDGAIIVTADAGRIVQANVHLVPDPSISTAETGTRHRTAERVARQAHVPVIAVSESMRMVTVYTPDGKWILEDVGAALARANQALQTLERYRQRFTEVAGNLQALEVEDAATLRDAVTAIQRAEMVLRIADEVEALSAELGSEGRLVRLQLDELLGGVGVERETLVRDHAAQRRLRSMRAMLRELGALPIEDLSDPAEVARILGHPQSAEALDAVSSPRGYRMLSRVPRLPAAIVDRIVAAFGRLPGIMAASTEELLDVEGVGAARAASIKEGLVRLAESSIVDRYL